MMKKMICMICALTLLLSACGTAEKNPQIAAALQTRIEEMENGVTEEDSGSASEESPGSALEEDSNDDPKENPIDRFYNAVETDGTTVAMDAAAGSQAAAWEAETRHLAEELKSQLPLQEDRDIVDEYITAAEEQVQRMDVMAIYPVSDVSIPEPERISTSGTLRGVMWAGGRSRIWRDTFYQLRWVLPFESSYTFIFDAAAAQEELSEWMA